MAIADQLTQLNQVKSDIKQALIGKDIDMTDVPFTGYAEKIAGIKTGVERTYLFKDGVLHPSITLGAGLNIKNNLIYTNAAGGTDWIFNYDIEANSTFFVKLTCTADAGSVRNEALCSLNVGRIGVARFNGNDELNEVITLGVLADKAVAKVLIYLYTYGNAMGIMEMWIE